MNSMPVIVELLSVGYLNEKSFMYKALVYYSIIYYQMQLAMFAKIYFSGYKWMKILTLQFDVAVRVRPTLEILTLVLRP